MQPGKATYRSIFMLKNTASLEKLGCDIHNLKIWILFYKMWDEEK
jgi:hypothetical protein